MVVLGWGEGVGMDTSREESSASNDVDGWNKGMVDVTSGYEGCTKLDARGTCRWPARRPPLPWPLMGGALTSIVNDGSLMGDLEDVDGSCVRCMWWSSPIACKTSIAIWWVSSKSSEIAT